MATIAVSDSSTTLDKPNVVIAEQLADAYATNSSNTAAAAPNPVAMVQDSAGGIRQIVVLGAGDGSQSINDGSTAHPLRATMADSSNNPVSAFPATYLRTTDEAHQLFYDSFDSALDTTNRWTSSQGSSGVAASNTNGLMSLGTGTSANGYSLLTSQASFTLPIPGWLGLSDAISIPDLASPTANAYRFWGQGTTPGTPTATAPLTNAVGFELSTAGNLYAVVYAGGTRTQIQDLSPTGNNTQPTDANPHRYIIYVRTDKTYWYIDGVTSAQLVATSNFQSPQVQTLPKLFLAVGGSTPPATNSQIQVTGATAWDTGKNEMQLSDGTFPWRKATISSLGALSVGITTPASYTPSNNYQLSITSSATQLTSATSKYVLVKNQSTNTVSVFIGYSSGVLTTTGLELVPGQVFGMPTTNPNAYWLISAGTATVDIMVF